MRDLCTGRDATDAFNAFHLHHARTLMKGYCMGRMESMSPFPPSHATLAFRDLAVQVKAAGLYRTSARFYLLTAAWCAVLLAAAIWLASHGFVVIGALTLALFWQQVRCSISCISLAILGQLCLAHSTALLLWRAAVATWACVANNFCVCPYTLAGYLCCYPTAPAHTLLHLGLRTFVRTCDTISLSCAVS